MSFEIVLIPWVELLVLDNVLADFVHAVDLPPIEHISHHPRRMLDIMLVTPAHTKRTESKDKTRVHAMS